VLPNAFQKTYNILCPILDAIRSAGGEAIAVKGDMTPKDEPLVGSIFSEDEIWSCTTCGHCITNCPLMIEHVDHIIDLRRYLVQVESRFPKELRQTFKGFENMSNPWGLASNTRGDWMAALSETGAPAVPHPENKPRFDYLFYVGCAGSFDDRYRKTTMATARLLQAAGVDFVCLGNDEMCCGETARRAGNEYLAQHLINFNLEMFDTMGVKKIITACPHCFNTFKNEYPQFGKTFEVIHHTEMIRDLIGKGALGPLRSFAGNGPGRQAHDFPFPGQFGKTRAQGHGAEKLAIGSLFTGSGQGLQIRPPGLENDQGRPVAGTVQAKDEGLV